MKKIAIYSPGASEPLGHPVYAQKLCGYLSGNNDVSIYTLKHDELNQKLQEANVKVLISDLYPVGAMDKNNFLKWGKLAPVIYGIKRIKYSYDLLLDYYKKNSQTDIFHLFEFEYFSLMIITFLYPKYVKKSILSFHSADFAWVKGRSLAINLYKSFLGYVFKYTLKKSLFILVQGHVLKEAFIKSMRVEALRDKIHVAGYGFEFNTEPVIPKEEACQKLGIEFGKKYALLFGVLRKSKGTLEAIEHFQDVDPSLTMICAGSEWDVSYKEAEELIDKMGLNNRIIKFFKYIEESDIPNLFSASELILIPHKSGFLSFSGPLALAVQYSKKVVASDVGEIGYFVRNSGLGEVFEPNNWGNFTQAINKSIKSNYSDLNLPFIESYTWKSIAMRIDNLYHSH